MKRIISVPAVSAPPRALLASPMPSLTPTFTRRSRLCSGNRVVLEESLPSEWPKALRGCVKRERRLLSGACLARSRSHTAKSSRGCCRCCLCPWKSQINHTRQPQITRNVCLRAHRRRWRGGGGAGSSTKTRRERRVQKCIFPVQFPLFFTRTDVLLFAISVSLQGSRCLRQLECTINYVGGGGRDWQKINRAKSLIAGLIKLLSCCIGLFSICVLQLCDFLSLFSPLLRSPRSPNTGRV